MSKTLTVAGLPPLVLRFAPVIEVSDQQFFELCQLNRDVRIERTSLRRLGDYATHRR
jgi:hypothetical protein